MILYKYTHTTTQATTGYFSCEPEPPLSLEKALSYLGECPYDDFMRRHIITRLLSLQTGQIGPAIKQAFADSPLPESILALIDELTLLHPAFGQTASPFRAQNQNTNQATSLIFLRWRHLPDRDVHRQWRKFFWLNIFEHRALKSPKACGLPPLYPDDLGMACNGLSSRDYITPSSSKAPLPGYGNSFTAPFSHSLTDIYPSYLDGQEPDLVPHTRPNAAETSALAQERLAAEGIIADREMRHTSSLSPVGLLRAWNLSSKTSLGRHEYLLEGQATTYGRGLSLADARVSCLMEMVERASAYLSISQLGIEGLTHQAPVRLCTRSAILGENGNAIDPNDYPLEVPYEDQPLYWMEGHSPGLADQGNQIYVPVQMAGLFSNLDEISLFSSFGSTGIATGCTYEEAKLAALLEILERDAMATTPFVKSQCFTLEADAVSEPDIFALLEDFRYRGINVQFQDITGQLGVPVYKCFVMNSKGAILAGHGAGISTRRAIISALTETPFPYPDGGPSGPLLRKLPVRLLKELPDFSLATPASNLALLEELLEKNGRDPVYIDLTRKSLGFPVVRALIPGMEVAADGDDFSRVPLRLYYNYQKLFQD